MAVTPPAKSKDTNWYKIP